MGGGNRTYSSQNGRIHVSKTKGKRKQIHADHQHDHSLRSVGLPVSTSMNQNVQSSSSRPESFIPKPYEEEKTPTYELITTHLSFYIIIIFGHLRDLLTILFKPKKRMYMQSQNGYAPLINSGFEAFYVRHFYNPLRDIFNRPVTDVPSRSIKVFQRDSYDKFETYVKTGEVTECLNLSSYNYLGFAQSEGPCADAVEETIRDHGVVVGSTRMDAGTTDLLVETETLIAKFLGQESAIVLSMGFAVNSTSIPALVEKGCLIVSDELNHASIVLGARMSGAVIKTFKHNDTADLEKVLRNNIALGQPKTGRAWKKILVIVEGLYSMEGTVCPLPQLLELKEKYKFYIFLDEAHSIGALGPNGRGVCDYYGIDHSKVDVLMGTFTKSFGAAGGYIAGRKSLIDRLRLYNHSSVYAEAVSPVVLKQIYTATKIIMGEDGSDEGKERIYALARNSKYFARALRKHGFIVYGSDESPVVPLMVYYPTKVAAFSREMLRRNIAVVAVGAPATPVLKCRIRFCLSASHTLEDLERAVEAISEVGDRLSLKISSRHP